MRKSIKFFKDIDKKMFICEANLNKEYSPNSFNSISSYLAMFPVELPLYFIKKYTKENDTVMDNFSGRGTTAYASRKLNRKFVGNDLNPYAFVLSKSKLINISNIEKIEKRIKELKNKYLLLPRSINITSEKYNDLKVFYSDFTLKQLIFLKNEIGINWKNNKDIDNLILALSLGLMHGPMKKDGTTIYFSLNMPNTISMSTNYVKKYSEINKLTKPNVDIFDNLIKRLKIKWEIFLSKNYESIFKYWNSLNSLNFLKNNSVDLVITSPPYLSLVDYTKSNWLRLWLLGFEKNNLKKEIKLSDSLDLKEYTNFIKKYLINISSKLKPKAKVCLVIGDVYDFELIENIWKEIKNEVPYSFLEVGIDTNTNNFKTSKLLNSRKGKATKVEKILILEKQN
ncbi:Adenine specific DNA methylase Mod (plasmid) [Mesomycoplasma conjunctivae]|nr:DNA methyltransferase [Mycoplasmopsis fermentans]VEU66672.1 Adenine specific DNA methylase Mod [Mesomycoplasma conjunctivae]ADV34115.1 Type II R/M system DNA methylase [Mycoplasmopsis fermentans M64]ADV34242.1 Type II R/M system DNA methylase [Mycoplasmopsis fermentans M64]ADV34474.1 Type II R/M system DNA methylase [Mycoplasmopsis fermentans M64]VEU60142.1 Adenine specific DNA methylase Mod [Mycoplasmopsis fermentans]